MVNNSLGNPDIYLYGMTVLSTIHRLDGTYPEPDTYREIKETYQIPGGETANSAIILANFGYSVKIGGPFLGVKTKDTILQFAGKYGIDCSGLHFDPGFDGVQDLVLIDKHSRTVFGKFQSYFSGEKHWSRPDEAAMKSAKIVSLDPFFGDESKYVAEYCANIHQKYVTIDCPFDSVIHKNSAANVISNEFTQNQYPGETIPELMQKYTESSIGLVIFTFGSREILYARKNTPIRKVIPYTVEVKSTLGAGDTFRAGVVYGVLNRMDDEMIVKFAAATAASVCKRFPMALDPPGIEEIMGLAKG